MACTVTGQNAVPVVHVSETVAHTEEKNHWNWIYGEPFPFPLFPPFFCNLQITVLAGWACLLVTT